MGKDSLDRLACLKSSLNASGISSDCSDVICSSWRDSTNKQYQYAWCKWSKWCLRNSFSPVNANMSVILNFLTEQFKLGKSYSILNTYRSAISSVHDFIDNAPIGQHHLIVRFFKGVANMRPSLPKYSFTWDVECVLRHIEGLWPLHQLSLKILTFRLLTLMALVTAQRSQTLKFLDISTIRRDQSGITFCLKKLTKTDKPGKFRNIFFPVFTDNEKLCVCKNLECYIDATKSFRKSNQLFISFRKPYNAVTSTTLARWLCLLLHNAGVDTSVFKAHSIRGASVSNALAKGASVADIVKTAGWTSDSMFRKFYNKPISICSKSNTSVKKVGDILLSSKCR